MGYPLELRVVTREASRFWGLWRNASKAVIVGGRQGEPQVQALVRILEGYLERLAPPQPASGGADLDVLTRRCSDLAGYS